MKKKVALFGNGWNGENLENFITGLRKVFEGNGVDIFVFTSHASYSLDQSSRNAENSIYLMPDFTFFDAAIIFGSGINSDESVRSILDKCKEANVPVITQGNEIENVSSITVNNYVGMRELCDHLIEQHNVKDVVFIAGPSDNEDSNLRIDALRQSLEAHGLSFNNENIVYANWEMRPVNRFIIDTYGKAKKKLPDAIICANDPMAMFALISLESIGVNVPEDTIVTGFDNLNDGRLFYPSVSSVDQLYMEQGTECAKMVMRLFEDKNLVLKKIINCKAAPGESCGCFNCKNEAEVRKMLGHDLLFKNYMADNLRGRASHLEICLMSCEEYEMIPEKLRQSFFDSVGSEGDDFHIYINAQYKDLTYMDTKDSEVPVQYYSPIMDVIASKTDGIINFDRVVNHPDTLMLGYTGEGEEKVYVFCPIRVGNSIVGYMVMGHQNNAFIDKKYVEFGAPLNRTMEKYQTNIKLSRLNEKLSLLMQKDALTSVKNRIAYDNAIAKIDKSIETDSQGPIAIVMCDINNLKTINDNLGHDSGDIYIKNCCRLICEVFKHSPVFRTGGDEFVIILTTEDYTDRIERLNEIRRKMDEISISANSPVNSVSIATGMAEYDPAKDKTIEDTVKRADAFMYINKAEMKAKLLL